MEQRPVKTFGTVKISFLFSKDFHLTKNKYKAVRNRIASYRAKHFFLPMKNIIVRIRVIRFLIIA